MRATTERWVLRLAVRGDDYAPAVEEAEPRRAILKDNAGRLRASVWTTQDTDWIDVLDVATYRFTRHSGDVTAFFADGLDDRNVVETFFGTVLPLHLQMATELEALHASGIVLEDGRVAAFCAESETGKTTLAYASSRRGLEVWADDAVAFDSTQPSVTSVGLPFRMRLRKDVAEYFKACAEFVRDAVPDDLAFELATAPRAELGAVVVFERAPSGPTLERITSGRALAMTMAHAYRYRPLAPERKRRMFDAYLNLVTSVPIFVARFRPGLVSLDFLLDEVERALRGASPTV